MNRAMEWALGLVSVILTAAFLSTVTGVGAWTAGGDSRAAGEGRYFHGGKAPPVSEGDRGCGSTGCHTAVPHAKDPTRAAFRNMHVRFVGCLVCHGRESRGSWKAEPPASAPKQALRDGAAVRERWKILAPMPAVAREKIHGLLGPGLPCRACHSQDGSRDIAARGGKDLPSGFADPVALRMIEEGAKQWIPDTMR